MSVGLDIGSKTIKVVELSESAGKFSLKSAGVVGFQGVDVEHLQDEKDFAGMANAIKKLFKDVKISSKDVNIAINESQVFSRTIRLPSLTDQEVVSAIKWEAEQYIPIPIQEAVVQHQILERRDTAIPPEVIVLLIASPRALIEKYVKVVSMAGLNCVSVETELIALSRSLSSESQTTILLDFGARSSDLAVTKGGMLFFARSIPTGGDALTRAVAQAFGVAPVQAEEYKRTYGLLKDKLEGKVGTSLEPMVRVIVEEIKKAMHYYQTEEKMDPPRTLILSGGVAGMPEISSYLANSLNLEVVVGNPFQKISTDAATLEKLMSFAPLYSIAIGLAMR